MALMRPILHPNGFTPRLAVALGLIVLVAACSDGAAPTTTVAPSTTLTTLAPATTTTPPAPSTTTSSLPPLVGYGGEVVIGVLEEPVTLDWFAGGGESAVAALIGAGVWAGVAEVDGVTLELVPDVVVALPSVANGGLVVNGDGTESVRFDIDPRAVWADGTPISGEDFRFTYEQVMRFDVASDKSGYELIVPESIVAGPKSFEFTMSRPSLEVESLFSVLLPAHAIGADDLVDGVWAERMWLSGGPFEFEQWVRGEYLTLVRNPNYWKVDESGQSLPYLDRVVFRFEPDLDTMLGEFEARQLDVINPGWDPALLDRLAALDGTAVDIAGSGEWEHISFQFGDGRFTRNPGSYNEHLEYRLAVAHAIDRQGLVDAVFDGWGEPMDSYLEAFIPAWSQGAWARYDYDPEKARDYLATLCEKDGVDCVANPPTAVFVTTSADIRMRLAETLAPMFADAGINYRFETDPALVFFGDTLDFGNYDLGNWSWKGNPGFVRAVAMHAAWSPTSTPPEGLAFSRWGSPAVSGKEEAGFNQGASSVINEKSARYGIIARLMEFTADERELHAYFAEAETLLAEDLVFIPLFEVPDPGVVWADEIAGYHHYPALDTWNIATWHRSDG
ncbi:MAG: hypothetical protein HZA58_03825 [Acidimicrobiia bacterium]|nr:hypothetical protein [Acidimicrobiia bacterium]